MAEPQGLNEMTASMGEEGLVLTRVLDAPRELVFKVWSELDHLKNWWGPTGLEWVRAELDFRPGGKFHYCMKSPEGDVLWGRFVYEEIAVPEKIVFVNSFSDPEGNAVRPSFSERFPIEVKNTVTFAEEDGRTRMTLQGDPIHATEEEIAFFKGMFESMREGFGGTFRQLADYLATLR